MELLFLIHNNVIGGSRAGGRRRRAPLTLPNSFVFTCVSAKKCPHQRSAPPTGRPPEREIMDLPLNVMSYICI